METTLNALLTLTFFAPMALMVAANLLTHRSDGPQVSAIAGRRATLVPMPPAKARVPANDPRYLEAA